MALQVLLVLSAISLARGQLGALEVEVEEYIPISGAQLQDLELEQNPRLLPLAATNERIFVEITSAQSASIVREGVNVNMDCLPWFNSFPDRGGNGSIRWLMLQRDENGMGMILTNYYVNEIAKLYVGIIGQSKHEHVQQVTGCARKGQVMFLQRKKYRVSKVN